MKGHPISPADAGERSRRYSIREGAFQAVMVGGGESYQSAFALLLHASAFQIGLLSALPQIVGTWAQLFSVKVLNRFHHRKTLIVVGAAGQAVVWLPLLALPLVFQDYAPWLLIACAMIYVAMGHFAIPAWNSLITDLVDPDRRGSYFGHRARLMAVTSFFSLCGAGLLLHAAETWERPWAGFAIVFLLAAASRSVSACYLARLEESTESVTREAEFHLLAFLRRERGSNFQRFLVFSGLMHVSVLIAGPYFVVYLLNHLHFTYLQYTAWLAAGMLGQFVTLKPWGLLGDRYGNKHVLTATGLLVPFLPMLYVISADFYYLIAVNFTGGVIWAGLSLGLQNYVFDAIRPEDRAKGVAVWNTVNALGWFVGAMIGSWLVAIVPSELGLLGWRLSLVSNLPFVFFISGVCRLIVSLSLLGTFREARRVEAISHRDLVAELPLIKPLAETFWGGARRE
ncbi:MAG: MFS transporter [Nitrospirae bacterium]|nr:MAG: MFS transporter [Nitrospirota bacterium]